MNTKKNLGKSMDLVSAWVRGYGQSPSRNLKVYIGEADHGYANGDILDANYVIGLLKEVANVDEIHGDQLTDLKQDVSNLEDQQTILNNALSVLEQSLNALVDEYKDELLRRIEALDNRIDDLENTVTWVSA